MEQTIHYIEDLQFACFALVFGIMAVQSRQDRTIRYLWCSYMLATVVSVIDVVLPHPYNNLTNTSILTVLSLRYAVLAAGLVYFTRRGHALARISFGIAAVTLCVVALSASSLRGPVLFTTDYSLLALQQMLLFALVLRSSEKATRIPRLLLAFLFALSAAYRLNQIHFVLSQRTPHDIWLRNLGIFLNGTILSGLLPFTIVWMMNTRDHNNLLQQSMFDPLTNLFNRRGLADAAHRELARYARSKQDFAVAIADIDHFKTLNDRHGHAYGDEVLTSFAEVSRSALRQSDIIARTGGEEFTLLLPLSSGETAEHVLNRLRNRFAALASAAPNGETAQTTVSIGVTCTGGRSGITWEHLLREADAAMYTAKRAGRNRTILHHASTLLDPTDNTDGNLPIA